MRNVRTAHCGLLRAAALVAGCLLATTGAAALEYREFPVPPGTPIAPGSEPLAVVVVVPQRGALVANKRVGYPGGHSLSGHFLLMAGGTPAEPGHNPMIDTSAALIASGTSAAAMAAGGVLAYGLIAFQEGTERKRSEAIAEHVGPVLEGHDWTPMLIDAARTRIDPALGAPSVLAFADREQAPAATARTLWLIGGHQFSSDGRFLLVHLIATLCEGRQVAADTCAPLYRNELTHIALFDASVEEHRNVKRALTWKALGREGIDAKIAEAWDDLFAMLAYDIVNFGREKKTPPILRVPVPYAIWTARPLARHGDRRWSRLPGGQLHSTHVRTPRN
jgi:hypothetical protein